MADTSTATGNAVGAVTGTVNNVVTKASGWIDNLFSIFGVYTASYSKYIVYIVLFLVLSKMFKFKFNVNTGGKK